MLTQNPRVRREIRHLADSAESTVREIRHAARDTREAVGPIQAEVKSLISQLESTLQALAREGSAESARAARQLREQAGAARARARERLDDAVGHAQATVAGAPIKAVAIAAGVGALIGLLLARRANGNGDDED
jgi:ElaB/YqjD/DUF883 family membrane-anchored ribosome-binding protein